MMLVLSRCIAFLMIWVVEVTLLVSLAALLNYFLRKKPGNVQAAIWTTTLVLAWLIPFAPWVVPNSLQWFSEPPVYSRVELSSVGEMFPNSFIPALQPLDLENPHQRESAVLFGSFGAEVVFAGLLIWLIGCLFMIVQWLRLRGCVGNLLSESHTVEDHAINRVVERTRQILFLEGPIEVRTADSALAPFVKNIKKPLLFVPHRMIEQWPEREQLAVVAHELSHLWRYDYFFHLAMQTLRIVFWFLPPVWWMQRELHRTQDGACDECAAVVLGSGKEYGHALTQLAEQCLIKERLFPALGILHVKHTLVQRLENIMNTRIQQLTRLSLRYKLVVLVAAILLFSLGGSFSLAVFSQTLDIHFLANHSGYAIEKLAYSSPYFAVAARAEQRRAVIYYEWRENQWFEHRRVPYEVADELKLETMVANETLTVLVFSTLTADREVLVLDNSQWDDVKIHRFTVKNPTPFQKYALYNNILYISNDSAGRNDLIPSSTWSVSRYTFSGSQYEKKDFPVQNDVFIAGIAAFDDHLIFTNYKMLWYASFQEDGITVSGTEEFFNEVHNSKEWELIQPTFIYNFNSNLVVVRDINKESTDPDNPLDPHGDADLLFIKWDKGQEPVVEQMLAAPVIDDPSKFYALRALTFFLRPDLIAVQGTLNTKVPDGEYTRVTEDKPGLFLYQRRNGIFENLKRIENLSSIYTSGNSILMTLSSAYMIDASFNASPIPIPYTQSSITEGIMLAGDYLYTTETASSGKSLLTYDTRLPSSLRLGSRTPLPANYRFGELHDGLLSMYYQLNLILYSINSDGTLGSLVDVPVISELQERKGLLIPGTTTYQWDDSLFVIPYLKAESLGDGFQTDRKHLNVLLYERSGNQIGNLLHSFVIQGELSIGKVYLGNRKLIVTKGGYIKDPNSSQYDFKAFLSILSLEQPDQPKELVEYPLPKEVLNGPVTPGNVVVHDPYVVIFTPVNGTYLFDISDPTHPQLNHVFPESEVNVSWFRDILLLSSKTELGFYSLRPGSPPNKIGALALNGPASIQSRGNRLYISRPQFGLDIYQILINESTDIVPWRMY